MSCHGEKLQHRPSCPADSLFLQAGTYKSAFLYSQAHAKAHLLQPGSCKSTFILAGEMQKPQQPPGQMVVQGCSLGEVLSPRPFLFALDLSLSVSSPPGLSGPGSLLLALGLVSQALKLFYLK